MAWEYDKVRFSNSKEVVTVRMICSCGTDMSGKVKYTKSWKNWCPGCKKSGGLVGHTPPKPNLTKFAGKNAPEGEISCRYCGYDACGVHGWGKDSKTRSMLLKPSGVAVDGTSNFSDSEFDSEDTVDAETQSRAGDAIGGEKTYEDILKEFAKATDSVFFVRNGILCFSTFPALTINASMNYFNSNKPIQKSVIEDGSYNIDVAEFGYYNTVYVKYNGGTVKAQHSELVRVFDEVAKVFDEPKIDKSTALKKADAYLSAYIRDFGMSVNFNMLATGKVVPGHFAFIQDEKTNSVERYFIKSNTTSWNPDSTITSSVTLTYGPDNLDNPEIPEIGVQSETTVSTESKVAVGTKGLAPDRGSSMVDNCKMTQNIIDYAAKFKTPEQLCKAIRNKLKPNYSGYYDFKRCPGDVLNGGGVNCMDGARLVVYACKSRGWSARMSTKVKCSGIDHRYAEIKGSDGRWKACDTVCTNPSGGLPKAF